MAQSHQEQTESFLRRKELPARVHQARPVAASERTHISVCWAPGRRTQVRSAPVHVPTPEQVRFPKSRNSTQAAGAPLLVPVPWGQRGLSLEP